MDNKMPLMNELKIEMSPTVLMCAAGGGVLGAVLALWAAPDSMGIVAATSFVFAVGSAMFGMFI